jgi:FdhE protein
VSQAAAESSRARRVDAATRFAARAERLRALSDGHAAGDWLRLLGRIADGQRAAVQEVHVPPARAPGRGPPLDFAHVRRDATWRRMLAVVLAAADAPDLPVATRDAIHRLAGADAPLLEGLADRHLTATLPADRLAAAPFVGAALQSWFGALADGLEPPAGAHSSGECPICGAPPVAGVIDGTTRLRYLHCSLCGAEWNVLRLTCVRCRGDAGLGYFHVEQDESAKAEACGECGGYLKLFDQERRAGLEPIADDAGTLALDLLMAQEGYHRLGASPYLAVAGD